jgi:hypothetical protein
MQKRLFLKTGLFGAGLLAIGATYYGLTRNRAEERQIVLKALIPAMLGSALPSDAKLNSVATAGNLSAVLTAIAGLSPAAQKEIDQLFGLLASPIGTRLAGIDSWHSASIAQLQHTLQSWRFHRFDLLQSAYHALHDLITGSWYADPTNWTAIGYSGPIKL